MAAQSTIVFADLGLATPQPPSVVAQSIAQQAQDSLAAGQFSVAIKPLSAADVEDAIRSMPSGHDRLCLDSNLILLDAGAMLAYAPYRARVLLTSDPFAHAEELAQLLKADAKAMRIRLHDTLLSAKRVVSMAGAAFDSVAPLLSHTPENRMFPPIALQAATAEMAAILVVNNEDETALLELMALLREAAPSQEFLAFDPASVLERPWKIVVHLGIARSTVPGARLSDAWAGSVPVLQLVNRSSLNAQNRRHSGAMSEFVVEHGRTGLQFSSADELVSVLRDLLLDPLPMRSVARGARRRVDPAAQWDLLLKAILL